MLSVMVIHDRECYYNRIEALLYTDVGLVEMSGKVRVNSNRRKAPGYVILLPLSKSMQGNLTMFERVRYCRIA